MRRATILLVRALIALLLVAAIADLPLPATSRARVRLHLIDFSESVRIPDPAGLTPEDALRMARWDAETRPRGDTIHWAAFAAGFAFESTDVRDPGSTDLAGALEAALARGPTEIVLYTDGRALPGRAPLLCRARGVPVHVFPLGPTQVRDARIARVVAPAEASPGDEVTVEVTVEATFAGPVRIRLGDEARELVVSPGVPALAAFAIRAPAAFSVRIEGDDACPANNEARGEVFARSERRRILVLSSGRPGLPDYDARVTSTFEDPHPYDAVVLDNVHLRPSEQATLSGYVRGLGGGLLLLGGPRSYALGRWQGTLLEDLSPLLATPPETLAVVIAIDRSGSMAPAGKLDAVLGIVEGVVRNSLRERDRWAAVPFSDTSEVITDLARLRRVEANGPTLIAEGIRQARLHLDSLPPARKHILLLTDGETKETPEQLKAAAALLGGIGLTVVTTNLDPGIGKVVRIADWKSLEAVLSDLVTLSLDLVLKAPGPLVFDEPRHPAMAGLSSASPPEVNRTTPRSDAQVAARAGDSPAVAFRETGRGRVGACSFGFEIDHPRLFRQAIEHVAGEPGRVSLSIDPPLVRARGIGGAPRLEAAYLARPSGEAGTLALEQVRSDVWEGALPVTRPGTVSVKLGRAHATATIPGSPELSALGVDRMALARIAQETGGRVLASSAELAGLPRPETPGRRSGRPLFLAAAAALLLLEIALSTFWKP